MGLQGFPPPPKAPTHPLLLAHTQEGVTFPRPSAHTQEGVTFPRPSAHTQEGVTFPRPSATGARISVASPAPEGKCSGWVVLHHPFLTYSARCGCVPGSTLIDCSCDSKSKIQKFVLARLLCPCSNAGVLLNSLWMFGSSLIEKTDLTASSSDKFSKSCQHLDAISIVS